MALAGPCMDSNTSNVNLNQIDTFSVVPDAYYSNTSNVNLNPRKFTHKAMPSMNSNTSNVNLNPTFNSGYLVPFYVFKYI